MFASRCGLTPDKWQCDLLRSRAKQLVLLCSRQSGKSTIAGILALHTALFEPGSLILHLAPALRQSQELFRKLKQAFNNLQMAEPLVEENMLRLELQNGSRIITLPGSTDATVRGFSSVSLLIVDEASRVDDSLYFAIRPMLAISGGRLVLLSMPFGRGGFYFNEWENGGEGWERVRVTADQCPRISAEWLENERNQIGGWWYRQEYGCEFVDTLDQYFRSEDIHACISYDVEVPDWLQGV